MAKKETYRHRNRDIVPGSQGVQGKRPEQVIIPDETRLAFETGRVLLIDKPLHWTSFDVVRKLRNILRIKKIGHAGTLDPLATGLLIVCTGKFTKRINEFMQQEKEYTGHFVLGAVTPTYDLESEPVNHSDISGITEAQVKAATAAFTGLISQHPPVYSAIKKDGVPLYELARRGDDVKTEPRAVTIHSFDITSVEFPVVKFRVVCSTGTYIRSLANDFGAALGCGAYLGSLRRTCIGDSKVSDAVTLDGLVSSLTEGKNLSGMNE